MCLVAHLWGPRNHFQRSVRISVPESPKIFAVFWGLVGLLELEGEVETLANLLVKARICEDWGVGVRPGAEVATAGCSTSETDPLIETVLAYPRTLPGGNSHPSAVARVLSAYHVAILDRRRSAQLYCLSTSGGLDPDFRHPPTPEKYPSRGGGV